MSEKCWLRDGCPGVTAACSVCQPTDDGCPTYRWFKELFLKEHGMIGHWKVLRDCANAGVYCSECDMKIFDNYPFPKRKSYFCSHCGTRMEGEPEFL